MRILRIMSSALLFALFLSAAVFSYDALAQECIPGLPCPEVLRTETDPIFPEPGPNQPGPNFDSLNLPKLESHPTPSQNNTCDADFMNQIYAKSFLEAEREVVVNAMYIRKPDSVLEYSCFDQHLAVGYEGIAGIFSDSELFSDRLVNILGWWGDTASIPTYGGTPTTRLDVFLGVDYNDASVEAAVLTALNSYILGEGAEDDGNFEHDFLGGATAVGNTLSYVAGGAESVCSHMYDVYYLAKCEDFDKNLAFLTFDQLIESEEDPRLLPWACEARHGITEALIALAENTEDAFVNYDPPETRLDLMTFYFAGCAGPPIPTGVRVLIEDYGTDIFGNPVLIRDEDFPDMVCPNPSCSVEYGGGACVE